MPSTAEIVFLLYTAVKNKDENIVAAVKALIIALATLPAADPTDGGLSVWLSGGDTLTLST